MPSLSVKITIWVILWCATWIIFVDYLPTHAHFEYIGLVSPFVVILLLLSELFESSGITSDAYTSVIIPGILFWAVIAFFIYTHRKQKKNNTTPES